MSAAERNREKVKNMAGGLPRAEPGVWPGDPQPPAPPAERASPEPLAQDAFIGPLGDYVRLTAPGTEADPAAVLLQALLLFGNAAGRRASGSDPPATTPASSR